MRVSESGHPSFVAEMRVLCPKDDLARCVGSQLSWPVIIMKLFVELSEVLRGAEAVNCLPFPESAPTDSWPLTLGSRRVDVTSA